MLNNMNNFFATIKAKMVKKQLVDTDLIAIGTKDLRYDGGYSPTAIRVEDFAASLPPVAVVTDGVTITGNGTLANPLVAVGGGGGTVNYAKVAYVDRVNGDDLTGALGNFGKAYLNPTAAMTAANAFGFTATYRGLVYLRQGTYSGTITLLPNIDVYCEPGVVFISGGFIDSVATGSVGIYGSAKFVTNARPLRAEFSSTIYMEFDEVNQNTNLSIGVIEVIPTAAYSTNVTINCNKIYSNCRNAFAITIRGNSNFNLNVTKEIKGPYQVIFIRQSADGTAWNGTAVINCPRIICENGGWVGNSASFKNAVYFFSVNSASKLTINGDIINETIGYGGSIQSCIVSTPGSSHSITVNGSLIGNDSVGLFAGGSVRFVLNGNSSSTSNAALCNGSANVIFNNSRLIKYSNFGGSPAVILDATCVAYFNNCMLYNAEGASSFVVRMTNVTATAYFYNCVGYSAGGAGAQFVYTGGVAAKIGTLNTQSNKLNDPACVEQFSVSGYSQNALLVLPNF
jgi:hypothetical protein